MRDVPPFDECPPDGAVWPGILATGAPVVHVESVRPGRPRPGCAATIVVTGLACATAGPVRLRIVADEGHETSPYTGLPRPDVAAALGPAGLASGFRGEVLVREGTPVPGGLLVLAVTRDGRVAGRRVRVDPAAAPVAPQDGLPPLEPAPRRRTADDPPPDLETVRQQAEEEAAAIDAAWSGLQDRLAAERLAEAFLAARAPETIVLPLADEPVVSIVVTAHDDASLTEACLRALAATLPGGPPAEVVVVDDSADPAVAALLADVRGVRVVRTTGGIGYLHAANLGARAARGTHVLQLNNDTQPQAGWLDAMLGRLEAQPWTGVVVAKLLFPDGRLQEAGGIVWRDGRCWNHGIGDVESAPAYRRPREVDYGSAAAMLVDGALWRALGGFDERYAPGYYEDVDLCFAARTRGRTVVYEPDARVVHARGGSMGSAGQGVSGRLIEDHRRVFRARWAAALADQPAYHPDAVEAAADRRSRPPG